MAVVEVRRRLLRDEPASLVVYGCFVGVPAVGIVVALVVGGLTGEVVAGSLVVVAVVWPLWPALVVRLAEGRWARLHAGDGELTVVDWRGRVRRFDRAAIRALHRYAVDETTERGTARHERHLVEIEGARPIWISPATWDPEAYPRLWPALGVTPADVQVLRHWAEAPELDTDEAGRARSGPWLFVLGWLAGSAVLMGLGFAIAHATEARP